MVEYLPFTNTVMFAASTDKKKRLQRTFNQGPYSQTILHNVLSLVLQLFQYLEAFECDTTSDWLNHTVSPSKSCVTFKFNGW